MRHCVNRHVVHDILQDCSAFIFTLKQLKKNRTTGNKTGSHIGIAVDTGWLETVASQSLDVVGETHIFPLKWLFLYCRNLKMKTVQSFKTSATTGAMIWHHIPEDFNLQHLHHENLKSSKFNQTILSYCI